MERIGIRELRQNASAWLRRVEQGESFEVTDHGRPIALLVPIPDGDELSGMIAAGRVTMPKGNLLDLGEPLPLLPGEISPSEILEQLRADER